METENIKKVLCAEKKLLENELSSIGKVDKDGDWEAVPEEQTTGPESDENDLADRSEDYEERSSILDSLEKRLEDINKALLKIENGDFGICENCKKPIEKDRLEINPAAPTCKDCMEKI
jgi:RNA polymerase-binding transcription factor DksA